MKFEIWNSCSVKCHRNTRVQQLHCFVCQMCSILHHRFKQRSAFCYCAI